MKNAAKLSALIAALLVAGPVLAEAPAHPQVWGKQMHRSISTQGNAALRELQNDFRRQAGEIEADFMPPQIWTLQDSPKKDRAAS